jgi:sterol desaturase/sphingolipid hydroxylase (fatty acid hydroxylase superfamily)
MSYFTTIALIIFFIALLFAEKKWPLRKLRRPWLHRIVVNFLLSIPMILAASLLIRPVGLYTVDWTMHMQFGLLHWIPMPAALQFLLGFLLLDLSFYYWHWLNHNVRLLWRFHNVHHADPDLDITTALRFHYGEVIYSVFFRLLQLGLLGVSPLTFIVYEIVFQTNTLFQHSNIRLPLRLERFLNKFIVTPRMHGIHHSQVPTELNSNYSVVFSCWDRIHKTLVLNVPQNDITIGVPGYQLPEDNRVLNLLILPFKTQRNYWHSPDGSSPHRKSPKPKANLLLE